MMDHWSLLIVCATLLATVSAGPDPTQCAAQCPESTKFNYAPGQTYVYTYESDVKTSVAGATEEHSSLHMRATANFEVMSKCEMALTLSDVTLLDSDPAQYDDRQAVDKSSDFKAALQQRPLRFAFIDGTVETVCPDPAEKTWVLNIKKGIISAIQNTMTSLIDSTTTTEVDVTGECPVTYEVTDTSRGTTKISKTKNLLACTDRNGYDAYFQATPYRVPSNIQSLPLMRTTHECTQEVSREGIISSSSCQEQHTFRPFAKHHNGATTEVSYTLTFSKMTAGVKTKSNRPIQNRVALLFEHKRSDDQMSRDVTEAQNTLESICASTAVDVRPETPGKFAELVRLMRQLDTPSLRSLYQRTVASKCAKTKKYFYDAIPLLGSTASVALARDLIKKGEVTNTEIAIWLTSFAFISNPTAELLNEAQGLLETTDHTFRKASLAVSSLVHTYCTIRSGCEDEAVVQAITKVFETKLRYNCRVETPEDHDAVLAALKAFGNLGFAGSSKAVLDRCVRNEELPTEMRVVALNAFRRMKCSTDRSEVMKVFTNPSQDSELRINAYLSIMPCADEQVIIKVKDMLEAEKVNQVGSFVWTHLTNLMESSSPHKQNIADIIDNANLKKEFDMDKRKFSRNMEWSLFSEMMNTGAAVESNVIWSEDSYIPRSSSLNLTVDVFGHSMNLLEIGARAQGLEKMIEQLMEQNSDNAIPSGVNQFDQQYKTPKEKMQASYYMRIFGNEIRYGDFHDWDPSTMKDKFNFLNFLIDLASEHSIDVTKSLMFLDASIAIPTSVGLPLTLSVDGTSSTSLKVKGKADIRQLFANPSNLDITGSISPSAAVEIEGVMGVDAFVARTGLRMVTTLHTSTVVDGQILMQGGKLIKIDLNMPRDRIEVFNLESKFYVTYRGGDREQKMITEDRTEKSGCYTDMAEVLGVEFCAELSLPQAAKTETSPWFPFNGPAKVKAFVNKVDTHTGYHFDIKYIQDKKQAAITDMITSTIDTPGSKVDRKISMELTVKRADNSLQLRVTSPWKKVEISGEGKYDSSLARVAARMAVDEKNMWSLLSELKMEDNKKTGLTITPNIEIVVAGSTPISLTGTMTLKEGRKADIDLTAAKGTSAVMTCKGSIQKTVETGKNNQASVKYDVNMDVDVPDTIKGKVTGFYKNAMEDTRTHSTRIMFEYSIGNRRSEKVTLNGKLRDKSQNGNIQYSADGSLINTIAPKYDFDFSTEVGKTPTSATISLDAGLDKTRRVKMTTSINYALGPDNKVSADISFEMPSQKWSSKASVDHMHSESQVRTIVSGKLNEKESSMELSHVRSFRPLKLDGDFKMKYPGGEIIVEHNVDERPNSEYINKLNVQFDKNARVEVNGVYKMKPRHEVNADISLPGYDKINFQGYVNPNPKNLQSRAEVTMGKRKYSTEFNYLLESSKFSSDAKVVYPSRTVTLTTELTKAGQVYSGSVTTKWDAEKDDAKKITIGGQVTVSSQTPAMQVNIEWYPKQFINFASNGKIEKGNWYKTTKDIEGKMQLKTSFKGAEDISGSFVFDNSNDVAFKVNGEVSWVPNKKLGSDFEIKFGQQDTTVTINAKTPFAGYKTMKLVTGYVLAMPKKQFDTNFEASWESKKITFTTSTLFDVKQRNFAERITLTTPFAGYELAEISIRHKDNGATFNSNIDATWSKAKKVSAAFKMDHQLTGSVFSNKGEISLMGPFQAFKAAKTSWDTQLQSGNLRLRAELEADKQRGVLDLQGSHQVTGNIRKVTGRGSLTTPFENAETISFSFERESDTKSWKYSKIESSAQWATDKVITYSHEMNLNPGSSYRYKSALMTPFENFKKCVTDLSFEISGTSYTTRNEVECGGKKYGLEGTLAINGYEFQGNARLTTPYNAASDITTAIKNSKVGNTWKSHYEISYGPSQKVEIDTEVALKDNVKIGFGLKTPLEEARRVAGSIGFVGNSRNFEASFEADHNLMDKKITGSLKADVSALPTIKINMNVITPFKPLSFIRYSFNHKMTSKTNYVAESKFELPQYTLGANGEFNIRSSKNFNTKASVELRAGTTASKFEATTQFQWMNSMTFRSTLKTPFDGFEDMSLNFAQDGTVKNWRINAEAAKGSDKIALNSEFIMAENIRGIFRLTTPFDRVEKVEVTFAHSGSLPSFKNSASVSVNERSYSIENEYNIQNGNAKIQSRIDTPIIGYETMSINIEHSGTPLNFKTVISGQYPSNSYTANIEFSSVASVTSGKLAVSLPFKNFNGFTADFSHDMKKWYDMSNNWAVEMFGQRYYGSSELRWAGSKSKTASFYVNIPEKYGAKMTITGDANNYLSTTKIEYAGKEINIRNSLKATRISYEEMRIEETYSIQTPYAGYENMEYSAIYLGTSKHLKFEATLKTSIRGYENFRMEYSLSCPDITNIRASIKIETPIDGWNMLTTTFAHTGESSDFTCSLAVAKNQQSIEQTIKFKKNWKQIEFVSTTTTPFRGWERLEQSFALNQVPNRAVITAEIQTPFANYNSFKIESTIEGRDVYDFKHSSRLETSMAGYEAFSYTVEMLRTTSDALTTRFNVRTPFKRYESTTFESLFAFGAKTQQLTVKVDTSFPEMDTISVSFNHEYVDPKDKTRGCSTKIELRTPIKGHEMNSLEHKWNRDPKTMKFDLSAKLDSSCPAGNGIFTLDFSLVHDMQSPLARLEITSPYERYSRFMTEISGKMDGSNNKMTLSGRAETSVPGYESFSASTVIEGNSNAYSVKSEVNTPITPYTRFASTVSFKTTRSGIESSIQVETSVPKWKRMGIRMVHNNQAKSLKNIVTIDTPFKGYEKIVADIDHKTPDAKTISTRISLDTGARDFAIVFNNKLDNAGMKSSIQATSNMTGWEQMSIEYSHEGEPSNFRGNVKITTPFKEMPVISGELRHKRSSSSFETSASIEYGSQKRYEFGIVLARPAGYTNTGDYEATLSLKSPHRVFQDFTFSGKHSRKSPLSDGELTLTLNGDRKMAVAYDYTSGPDYKYRISFTDPTPMEYRVSFAKGQQTVNMEVSANWNMQRSDSNAKVTLELTNQVESAQTTRAISVALTTPVREMLLSTSYVMSKDRFAHKMEVQLEAGSKLSYDIDLSRSMKRNLVTYDGKITINSQMEVLINHKIVNNKQHVTQIAIKSANRLVIKSDLTLLKSPSFKHLFTVQHPRFSKDVTIATEGNIEPGKLYDGKVGIKYEDQAIDFTGRIADESSRSDMKYTAECRLTHANSNTDFQFKSEMKNDQKSVGGSVEYKWMTSDRTTQTLSARTDFNKIQNEMIAEIVTPMGTSSVNGRLTYGDHDNGVYRTTITMVMGANSYRSECEFNRQERSVDAKIYYTAENFLHVYAKYISAYHMQFEIYRQHDGEKITDVMMALQLQEQNIINGKLNIRPALTREINEWLSESDFSTSVGRTWETVSDAMEREMEVKVREWKRAAQPITRIVTAIAGEMDSYTQQVRKVFRQLYKDNDFYVRDMADATSKAYTALSRHISNKLDEMSDSISRWREQMQYNMHTTSKRISKSLANLRVTISDALDMTAEYATRAFNTVAEYWPYYADLKARLNDLNDIITAKIAELKDRIKQHPAVEPYLRRLPASPTTAHYMAAMRDVAVDYARSHVDEDTVKYAQDVWYNVGRRSEIRDIMKAFKAYIDKVKYYFSYYEIDSASRSLLSDFYTKVWQMVKTQTMDLIDNYIQVDRTRWTTWDPQNGQWEFDVWVPIRLPNLQRLPDMPSMQAYMNRLKDMAGDIMPESDWTFWDTWYTYKPSIDYANIVPPFKTRAALVGNQHYMTFDRKFYEYVGECTYLLARDFINGKFSVHVNYERTQDGPAKKSITVATSGKQITISPSGRTAVDGKRSELPLQLDGTTVTRNGNTVRLDSTNGLTVSCDLAHDRCTLNVTGWYYGKTAGMFGTYDNEPHNDHIMSNNKMADDLETLADSWTVGQKCRKTNYAMSSSKNGRRSTLCAKYFEDSTSEFRNCFKIVSPEPFMTMCLNDIPTSANRIESDEDVCNITAFYVDECRREGVPLRQPKVCVRCQMESGRSLFEGESVMLNEAQANVPRSADVVFMIQHGSCNKAPVDKLKTLVDEIEKAYRMRGMEKMRYTIVGYGGQGPLANAHTHTIDGQIFNNREMFQYGLENFNTMLASDSPADSLLALRYITRLPFRSGVSKTVVLLPCSACYERTISYAEIQQVLYESDIRLHLVTDHSFDIKGKTPKTVSNYGADKEAVYSRRDAGKKDVTGDRDVRSQVTMPKDLCAALAEEMDGAVFSSQQMSNRRPDEIKAFFDVFAHVIARKGQPSKCQRCECVADETGTGKSMCRSCEDRLPVHGYGAPFVMDEVTTTTPVVSTTPATAPEMIRKGPVNPIVVKPIVTKQPTTTTVTTPVATKPVKPVPPKVKPAPKPKPVKAKA